MLHLLKYLDGPWERVREYLRSDLEHIEAAVNQRWQQTFTDDNQLQAFTIAGDSTIDTQYIANTGIGHTPRWDYVNLSNGVTNRLPFNHLVAATAPSVLVGRESGTTGNFEQISLGTGLTMAGTTLSTNSSAGTFTKVTNTSTGTQNDLNIGVSGNTYCEWSGASDVTITGITLGVSGRLLIFKNTGTKVAYFSDNAGGSSAVNRLQNIVTSSTTAVAPNGWIAYLHNGTDWQLVAHEQGDYITPAFSAGDFTLNGDRTWTVESGDVTTYQWKLIGRSLNVTWVLETTTLSGGTSSTTAKIQIPNSFTAAKTALALSVYFILNGATIASGYSSVSASGTVINLVKTDATDLGTGTNNCYFYGQILFSVN